MGYRVLTYADPYNLHKEEYWDEIKGLPHLCASTALVEGINHLYRDSITSLICTIDRAIDVYFGPWCHNFELYIKQYSVLTKFLATHFSNRNHAFYNGIRSNQPELLNAVRFLKELNICSVNLKSKDFPRKEHRLLLNILHYIEEENIELFEIPNYHKDINSTFMVMIDNIMENIMMDSERKKLYIEKLLRIKESMNEAPIKKIVIHGLHQFKPLMSRMFENFSKNGVEIIFLFNYQEEYKNIYETWLNVYSLLETKIEFSNNIAPIRQAFDTTSNKIARCFGNFVEGKEPERSFSDLPFYVFENSTDFATYIIHFYEKGRKKNNEAPLEHMSQHFFSADTSVENLLKIYYPEQYRERHFLSYPIGHFFSELYGLWDNEAKTLAYNFPSIKEIISAGLLCKSPQSNLLSVFTKLELYFKGVKTMKEAIDRLEGLIKNIEIIHKKSESDPSYRLYKKFDFYTVKTDDVRDIIQLFEQLLYLSDIFFEKNSKNDLDFSRHYQEVFGFIKEHSNMSSINHEEKKLMERLLMKLSRATELDVQGPFDDLKQSIAFYLKQASEIENYGSIIKKFEEIEGGIWKSKGSDHDQTYHFASLSDTRFQKSPDSILPWPLSIDFLEKTYPPTETLYQLYMTSINEYHMWLMYQLFHGWYFNRRNIAVSFIKNTERDETNQPYYFFDLIGAQPAAPLETVNRKDGRKSTATYITNKKLHDKSISKLSAQNFSLCPYRFFNEILLKQKWKSGYANEYICKLYYFQVLVLHKVWSIFSGKPIAYYQKHLPSILENELQKTKPFFPFLKTMLDYYDIKRQIRGYFDKTCINHSKRIVNPYNTAFMNIKKNFVYGQYRNASGQNKVRFLWQYEYNQRYPKQLTSELYDYLNSGYVFKTSSDDWCEQCKYDTFCLQKYFNA